MKFMPVLLLPFLFISNALAADITAQNLVGRYRIDAKAFTKSAHFRLNVINASEFEIQRIFDDHDGTVCNGSFKVEKESRFWPFPDSMVFKGVGSCPDNRSRMMDFKVIFKNVAVENLRAGAAVQISSSLAAGITVGATMKQE